MIPSRLNLLSPSKRQHLRTMVRFQFIKNTLEVFLILACLAAIVLIGGQTILEGYFSDLTSTIVSTQSRHTKTNREIQQINQTLIMIDKVQKEYSQLTQYIAGVSNKIPNEITLRALEINLDSKEVTLTGRAQTRESLLSLKDQLESIEWLGTVNIPISQLTQKEDIEFSLSVKME